MTFPGAASGLKEVFENVYASNTMTHMLTGKAFSRVVRGHFLLNTALHILIMSESVGVSISDLPISED